MLKLSVLLALAAAACTIETTAPPPGEGSGTGTGGGSGSSGSSSGGGGAPSGAPDGGASDAGAPGPEAGVDAGGGGPAAAGFVLSAYKDTSINMNWNTNVISTKLSGSAVALADDLKAHAAKAITLAFATGECGAENWAGVPGAALATANAASFAQSGVKYVLSTGGAAGTFTCASDAGMSAFIDRWMSPNLVGVDFDIEGGQSQETLDALAARVVAAHAKYASLRFSLTLATVAAGTAGSSKAVSLGAGAPDGLNALGVGAVASMKKAAGGAWPSYVTVNLMVMDYGAASPGNCVVAGGVCDMGQSAVQAAYNLHDKWGVPYASVELTPMIGGNDAQDEHFTLADVDTVMAFSLSQGLAGVHWWSYDRDTDCPMGSASPTCNSIGNAGTYGYLTRFSSLVK
jgi:hypothetical protein